MIRRCCSTTLVSRAIAISSTCCGALARQLIIWSTGGQLPAAEPWPGSSSSGVQVDNYLLQSLGPAAHHLEYRWTTTCCRALARQLIIWSTGGQLPLQSLGPAAHHLEYRWTTTCCRALARQLIIWSTGGQLPAAEHWPGSSSSGVQVDNYMLQSLGPAAHHLEYRWTTTCCRALARQLIIWSTGGQLHAAEPWPGSSSSGVQVDNYMLQSLGPAAHHLEYRWRTLQKISVENQLLLTLIKLQHILSHG